MLAMLASKEPAFAPRAVAPPFHSESRHYSMDIRDKIAAKIHGYKDCLARVESELNCEMLRQFGDRRFKYLLFLALERNVYSFGVSELEELLHEEARES